MHQRPKVAYEKIRSYLKSNTIEEMSNNFVLAIYVLQTENILAVA
jgi:hypothetical protein